MQFDGLVTRQGAEVGYKVCSEQACLLDTEIVGAHLCLGMETGSVSHIPSPARC